MHCFCRNARRCCPRWPHSAGTLSPESLATQLLAHVDRLGGDEAASPPVSTAAARSAVRLEGPFAVHIHGGTFDRLATLLLEACEHVVAARTSGADVKDDVLYAAIAATRVFSANLRRAVLAGVAPTPLPKAVSDACAMAVKVLDVCSGVEQLDALASAARAAYTVSLGECVWVSGMQPRAGVAPRRRVVTPDTC